jgi:hypothetical protein
MNSFITATINWITSTTTPYDPQALSMPLDDLQVEDSSDFPTLDAAETLAELQDYAPAVGRLTYGLRTNWAVFPTHFDDWICQFSWPD